MREKSGKMSNKNRPLETILYKICIQSTHSKGRKPMTKSRSFLTAFLTFFAVMSIAYGARVPKIVLYEFFDEKYRQGGFDYTYPPEAKISFDKEEGYKSKVALKVNLVTKEYSGASVCLYNETFDLEKYRWNSTLEFMIRGEKGGEQVLIGLLDEEISDDKKTQTKLSLNRYIPGGKITTDWKQVKIPISEFSSRGQYYDQDKKIELPALVDWSKIAEFRISADKGVNTSDPVVYIDNIQFVKSKKVEPKNEEFWDFRKETVKAVENPGQYKAGEKVLGELFIDDYPAGGYGEVYGGRTAKIMQPTDSDKNKKVLALYMDDQEWSGVTMVMGKGKFVDLSKVRNQGGLYLWAKGGNGGEQAWIGLMDDQGNDIKVQTKIGLNDWGKLKKDEWTLFKIPLKRFLDNGLFWDAEKQAEIAHKFDWTKVNGVRISVGKEFNAKILDKKTDPVTIYLDQVVFVDDVDWDDPDVYWDNFASKADDKLIHDFEKEKTSMWEPSTGPKSKVKYKIGKSKLDGQALIIEDYLLGDWVDVVADYQKVGKKFPNLERDWSKHWGLAFEVYTDKPWQGITVQIGDSGKELWVQNTGVPRGRTRVLVPFRNFNKFPYYQPPEAEQNGNFDLDNVNVLDFKPSGEGTRGSFQIDNVTLTNLREIKREKGPAEAPYTIAGNFGKVVTEKINPGIHGINAALWDGDLLDPQTVKYVSKVPHNVVRYPGGLRADDDHWEEVLANKDWMVDTDEFLEWCKQTNTEPMITVNFGKGTPEEAARWVHHVNVKKKANVKYWEIGNELYGNWHVNYEEYGKDGGHAYGKRARKFIEAMKAVDPSIEVTVVWVLEGEWNKNVFKYTADIADGVNVHHYPQHFGQENDFALLAAPQTLDGIIPGVQAALDEYGEKGKDYGIWLTEWNSVDFNPGPQTIQLVNGLFVADYLGMLAVHNIEIANYWDIHNSLTPEGGDYGYLTRTGDPAGDNVPRPSYWAFYLAANALQGKLVESTPADEQVTTYLTQEGDTKHLLVINKSKDTKFKTTLKIPGFTGKGTIEILEEKNKMKGPEKKNITVKEGQVIEFPKFSITKISIK